MDECYIVDDSADGYKSGVLFSQWIDSCGYVSPWEFDVEGFGEMTWDHFRAVMYEPEFRTGVLQHAGVHGLKRLEGRTSDMRNLTYQEFIDLVSNKRRRSLKIAVHELDHEYDCSTLSTRKEVPSTPSDIVDKMVHRIAVDFVPPEYRKNYEAEYACCPPPLFLITVTLLELACYAYYSLLSNDFSARGPLPVDSVIIYRPDRRVELWRFLLYIFIHAGWVHLLFNVLVQLLVGLPLEMVHGSVRIAIIYFSGVLAGSLATSVFDKDVYLVGASGGVYALLAAHVSNVVLNYTHIECAIFRIFSIILVASADVGFAIYNRYSAAPYVNAMSYVAHIAGATAGLTIGLVVLKSFDQRLWHSCLWWTALAAYLTCVLFAVCYNLYLY